MVESPFEIPTDHKSAARAMLAAAGPVEPPPSPELAPGPTLSPSMRKRRAEYFFSRKTPALLNQVRTLYRRGESYSAIGRAIGINSDTVRRWIDPDYDQTRRSRAGRNVPQVGETEADTEMLPTLPFVPGITISGRYRMKPRPLPK